MEAIGQDSVCTSWDDGGVESGVWSGTCRGMWYRLLLRTCVRRFLYLRFVELCVDCMRYLGVVAG